MNALTLVATFGILVFVFQDGRLEGVLGYTSQGALQLTQPVLLFAIAFGLATDYGVFLLTRIKEAWDAGLPNREAVAVGLERTGRIVTAAALLFCIAVGAFATSKVVMVKEVGDRHRARGADRRDDRPRAARAVADGDPRPVELVAGNAAGAQPSTTRSVIVAGFADGRPNESTAQTLTHDVPDGSMRAVSCGAADRRVPGRRENRCAFSAQAPEIDAGDERLGVLVLDGEEGRDGHRRRPAEPHRELVRGRSSAPRSAPSASRSPR